MSGLFIAQIIVAFLYGAAGTDGEITIHIDGDEDISGVRVATRDGLTFISMDDIAERLDISPKEIGEGMIGLCQEEICIAVDLDNENDAVRASGALMINADLIAQTLNSEVEWLIAGKVLRFAPVDQILLDTVVKTGDVVPNFALPAVSDGKMVSLNSFRGKRVLLFMWATW